MPSLIKVGIVFIVLLLLTFKKVPLWVNLFVSAFLLGLLFQLPVVRIGLDILSTALEKKTLLLIGALILILLFSTLMKETGRTEEILEGFRHIFKDIRIVIALLPALIGLLPIVGGALVSAPMVVAGSDELKLSPERRTFINFWFRHVWEYILPTFPAVILTATVMEIPLQTFSWLNLPLTPVAILGGAFFGFYGISKSSKDLNLSISRISTGRLLLNLSPLLTAILLVVSFQVELAYALGTVILGMIPLFRIGWEKVFKGFRQSLDMGLLLSMVGVLAFKDVLEDSQAMVSISASLSGSGIPIPVIVLLLPFLIGFMNGYVIAAIGISMPVLLPFLKGHPQFEGYMLLGFVSGFCGSQLSPFHPCLFLTKDYFGAGWEGVYKLSIPPTVLIILVRLLMTLFL